MNVVTRMLFCPDFKFVMEKFSKEYNKERKVIFEKFLQYGIIGTGWSYLELKKGWDSEAVFTKNAEQHDISRMLSTQLATLCQLQENDLIWLVCDKTYWLFRVTENCVGREWEDAEIAKDKEWLLLHDIGHYVKGEWLEIGKKADVPEHVYKAMRGMTFCKMKKDLGMSFGVWNAKSKGFKY